jgi:hypothetical protein
MNLLELPPVFSWSLVGLCCLLWLLAGCSASTDTSVPQTSTQSVTGTKILLRSSPTLKGRAGFQGSQSLAWCHVLSESLQFAVRRALVSEVIAGFVFCACESGSSWEGRYVLLMAVADRQPAVKMRRKLMND